MKTKFTGYLILAAVVLFSCNKETSSEPANISSIQQVASQLQAIAVITSTTTQGDSVYVVHTCNANESLDSTQLSSLPAVVLGYLDSTYTGYTAQSAYSVKNSSGVMDGYVVIIQYNSNPVAVKFDATGNFVRVLEQVEGHDLMGKGWHRGGCFDNRDGMHRDTIAISALPSAILSCMGANYPQDTLLHAFVKRNGNYLVVSKNNGLYVTVFDSAAVFIRHDLLQDHHGPVASVAENALPSAISSYLTTTYPGYVFDGAFSVSVSGVVQGYWVMIDSNNTKVAVLFDAAGNFKGVRVLW